MLLLSLLVLACASPSSPAATPVPASAATFSIGVQGNHLVDGAGRPVRLLGVNRSGTEYACIQGWGLFDGPSSDASVAAMAAWHINAVRVPLNEDCWLAINGAPAQYSGATYKAAVTAYVHLLNTHGLYAVLDLHLNAPGAAQATGQREMADADHSPAFWADVAKTFSGENAVLFDLYNEPHDISWDCWRDGCSSPGWQTAGSSHW
ncbi:MAG: endoglucanase [Chloroflexota bacterium]|nr:endoglucanase [Chloroflexota bacterium]